MKRAHYRPMKDGFRVDRREFVKTLGACSIAAGGAVFAPMPLAGEQTAAPSKVETSIDDFMKVPKGKHALPGPFPGVVVKVTDRRALVGDKFDGKVVGEMVQKGLQNLTGKNAKDSFRLFFQPTDVVGLKVNPVGAPLISTRLELVDAVVAWLVAGGLPRKNIVIWDRFDYMLKDAGFTPERFPGVTIEGLQTMDENGNKWRDKNGNHVSIDNFDREVFYLAKGAVWQSDRNQTNEEGYLNQHVFNGDYSYFGKLITKKLTKIVNLAAYKNTGPAISMATKNIGYGSICNTGRLHASMSLKLNTEVHAAPVIREKLVLNITDGLRGQYDGGPDKNAQFVYPNHSLYFATDPFALDMVGHQEIVAKRKASGIAVNEHPKFTDYLHYAERLGLGIASPDKIRIVRA
jgi:hypothetical protein